MSFSIREKSEVGFWEYQMFGFLSFILNKKKDFLVITEKRILYIIKNKLIKDIEYHDFSSIKFNIFNDILSFKNIKREQKTINIKEFRITYEEIQVIKKALQQ